ncbi:hypothetical protein AWC38_SpisGene13316 [Stylophora pistillata]|uniref:Apple domain-containing protein n=1 Tax=Stylophora pistillata TaxID=50429 RepID=A0A2B4S0Y6_STYPI|nr:hypothetical protein AWC38_SpisGene13316 [Stylophora pistillata]
MMLQKHIFETITGAAVGDVCLLKCYRDVRCQSFNYVFTQDKCELSNRTKEARPEDFVPNSERYYFRRDMKRAHLGAIPELPADSCKEIKSSEGGQAVSGVYWLNFIKPDIPVLAHCDMKTEEVETVGFVHHMELFVFSSKDSLHSGKTKMKEPVRLRALVNCPPKKLDCIELWHSESCATHIEWEFC